MWVSYNGVGQHDTKTATAYVTRFLLRSLSALGVESRAGSPRPLEGVVQGSNTDEYDFFAEMGLVSLLYLYHCVVLNTLFGSGGVHASTRIRHADGR